MKNVIIVYQLDLEVCARVKKRDYLYYSKSEIIENMLWGEVIIVNGNNLVSFEAGLLKFFIAISDGLQKINSGEEIENEIFDTYNNYYLSMKIHDKNIVEVIFNKQEAFFFEIKVLLNKIKNMKLRLFEDLKILYPDYLNLKQIDYLTHKLTEK